MSLAPADLATLRQIVRAGSEGCTFGPDGELPLSAIMGLALDCLVKIEPGEPQRAIVSAKGAAVFKAARTLAHTQEA